MSINLLKRAQTPQIQRAQVKKTLNIITFIFIITFITVFTSLVVINIFLTLNLNNTNTRVKNAEIKLNALAPVEVTQIAINDKITALEKIFASDPKFESQIKGFEELTPNDAFISELMLDEQGSLIKVTSPQLSTLSQFVVNLISDGKQNFKKIFLEDLSIDENGRYRISISVEREK